MYSETLKFLSPPLEANWGNNSFLGLTRRVKTRKRQTSYVTDQRLGYWVNFKAYFDINSTLGQVRRVKFFKKSKLVSLIIYQYFFSTTKIKMRCFMEHTSLLRSISSKGPVMIFRRGQGGRISVGITWSSDGTEKELVVGTENIGRTTVNGLPTNCQSGRGGTSEIIAKPYEGIRSIFSGRNQNLPTPLPPQNK